MRGLAVLALIAVVYFAGLFLFNIRKLNGLYQRAYLQMQTDVEGALTTFQPAMGVKDYDSLGKGTQIRQAFFRALIVAGESIFRGASFGDMDARNAKAALKALNETAVLPAEEIDSGHMLIAAAAGSIAETVAEEGFLDDFDSYRRVLSDLAQSDILRAGARPAIAEALAKANQVDRFPIALRTAEFRAGQAIGQGLDYLGLVREGPSGAVPAVDAAAWRPGEAEQAFHAASDAIAAFAQTWKTPPSGELARLKAAALHNAAMTRLGYSLLTMRGAAWEMYFLPNFQSTGESSPQEHRSNYLIGMFGYFQESIAATRAMAPGDARRGDIARSAQLGIAVGQQRLAANLTEAARALAAYRTMAPGDADAAALRPRIVFFW